MVKASRKTKTIIARHPKFRDQVLKPVISENTDSQDIFEAGLIDHYIVRPPILEKTPLSDYAAWFEFSSYKKSKTVENEDDNYDDANLEMPEVTSGDDILDSIKAGTQFKLMDGSGYITKRRFSCILMYNRSEKDILENATSTLLLFKSFRNEFTEIHDADLYKVMEENQEEIKKNQEKYEKNATLFDNLDELEKLFKDENGDPILDQNDEEIETENLTEVMDFEEKYANNDVAPRKEEDSDKISYEELKKQVRSLNNDQRQLFDDIVERFSLPLGHLEPLLLHINGAAGTGKSFLLKTLINGVRYVTEKRKLSINPEQPTVVVGAPTNNAAFHIGGNTIHSLLGFNFGDEDINAYCQTNGQQAKDLPWKFENTRLMALDEVSMIGSNMFTKISLRLQEILNLHPKWRFNSFGGLDIVLLGDFFQLPPVLDRYIFLKSTLRGRCESLSNNHYEDNVTCYTLNEKIRSQEDSRFGDLCDAIAKETLSSEDSDLLQSRCDIHCPQEEDPENFTNGNLMVLCLENSRINELNEHYLRKFNKDSKIYTFHSQDRFAHLSEPVGEVGLNYTECGNLPSVLSLKLNSPVMLTKNISKADGLLNGKRGFIHEIDEINGICWVVFQEDIGNISRMKEKSRPKVYCAKAVPIRMWKNVVSFNINGKKKRGPVVNRRNQFPLVLSYATTIHKAQGLTLDYVIVDLKRNSKRAISAGAFYTAITRIRSLDKLFLRNYDKTCIRTDSRVLEEIKSLSKKPYTFLKRYLSQSAFQNHTDETKIVFLNINGFSSHKEDISADRNLLEGDLIVLAETKTKAGCKTLNFDGYDCISVLNAVNNQSGGMALMCRKESNKSINVIEKNHVSFQSSYLQYMKIEVEGKLFSFVYVHPDMHTKDRNWLKEQMRIFQDSSGISTYYFDFI